VDQKSTLSDAVRAGEPSPAPSDPANDWQDRSERLRLLLDQQISLIDRLASAPDSQLMDLKGETSYLTYHPTRVAEISAMIAVTLSLPDSEVSLIRRAAPLHDLGKLAIPEEILLKPSSLTAEEFEIIKTHTLIGARLLRPPGKRSRLLELAEEIAGSHHENWDGTGYPHGLKGTEIPLAGRIVAVADVFDALTRTRPYKSAWGIDEAVTAVTAYRGTKFDPRIVDVFLDLHRVGRLPAYRHAV
jgi:putative two-component system response regulator